MSPARGSLPQALLLGAAGLYWLSVAAANGFGAFVVATAPGALMLAGAIGLQSLPDDARPLQLGALGAVLGLLVALPLFAIVGFPRAAVLAALAIAAVVGIGRATLAASSTPEDVPAAESSHRYSAEVATDQALLAFMIQTLRVPEAADHERIPREIDEARERFQDAGWLEDPHAYHVPPPPLERVELTSHSSLGTAYRRLTFESGYEPREGEPGRERWLDRVANRTAHARVLRHEGPPRPWLVCIHGYQMGSAAIDLPAFDAARLHRERGLNLLLPVLPLHGPRKVGRISGEHFLTADFLDSVHAEAQAMWDIRRMLQWVRSEGGERVGVYGLSLGGYTTALLSALEPDLACALAGIPATDFARLVWRHGPPRSLLIGQEAGLDRAAVDEVLRVISPLAMKCLVPRERRAIFGAIGDQLVPADQVRDLWRAWDRPEIAWYPGGHVTFPLHRHVRSLVGRTFDEAGLVG